jgi:hypothetical protein
MRAMDEGDLAVGRVAGTGRVFRVGHRIGNAQPVGVPSPLLFLRVVDFFHVFAGGQPHARQQWIGVAQGTHGFPEIVLGDLVGGRVRNPVAAGLRAMHKNIPRHDVTFDAAILRVLHDPAPEGDLLLDGHLLQRREFPRLIIHVQAREGGIPHRSGFPLHIRECHVGILRHAHHRGERMQTPERKQIHAMPRHVIEHPGPEVGFPHIRDVGLRGIRIIRVTRRTGVQRDVELDAALLQIRIRLPVRYTA